jgi:large subunit ribosomal protein L5
MEITGQKSHTIHSKKAISNFKLRIGMPVMLRVTLRGKKAYDMIERLVTYVFPRIRDFAGLSPKKFDKMGNYHMGLKQQTLFPELIPEQITTPMGLQISITTSAQTTEHSRALLEQL